MELVELIDRCLYEDELRDILLTIGEDPNGAKHDLITKLLESKDPAEVLRLIDEDMLTIICLESGVPFVLDKDQMVDYILQDVLGELHDYIEICQEAEVAKQQEVEENPPEVDFDGVLSAVGQWVPVNVYLPRAVITEELGLFLRNSGYPIKVRADADLRVGSNICVELARGRVPKDIDGLLERMVDDMSRSRFAIGVMYGVESEDVVERLEESLESVFPEPDRVAIVLI